MASINLAERQDAQQVVDEIRANEQLRDASVILFQEVLYEDSDGGVLQRISRELGGDIVFSSTTEPRPNGQLDGMALLSRLPITAPDALVLPRYKLNMRSRCRHALAVTVAPLGGVPIRVFNTHLDTRINARKRVAQIAPVVEAASRFPGPAIIGGDLNTNPMFWVGHMLFVPWAQNQHEPLDQMLSEHHFSTPMDGSEATHDKLGFRIDWIYLRGLRSSQWGVQPLRFSNHRAVWLKLDN